MKSNKKFRVIFAILFICSIFVSCDQNGKGDKILTVNLVPNDSDYASEIEVIKESLVKGGGITLSGTAIKEIDPNFASKYGVTDSEGRYSVIPAIVNFVGDNGWNLIQVLAYEGASVQSFKCEYIFVKTR
jgi:hypothetical protein